MQNQELASRGTRLGAALIDGIIGIIAFIPVMSFTGVWEQIAAGETLSFSTAMTLSIAGIIIFLLLHGYFLAQNGQTIGKKVLDIKIVDLHGNKPEFVSLIARRYLPLWVISQIPFVGGLFGLIDTLFIFREDRRCIHDHIAGTKVVENTSISLSKSEF